MRTVHARETRPNPGSTAQPSVRSHDPHSVCIAADEIRIGSVSLDIARYELAASSAMRYLIGVRALRLWRTQQDYAAMLIVSRAAGGKSS